MDIKYGINASNGPSLSINLWEQQFEHTRRASLNSGQLNRERSLVDT
jgi:hypothetical protein